MRLLGWEIRRIPKADWPAPPPVMGPGGGPLYYFGGTYIYWWKADTTTWEPVDVGAKRVDWEGKRKVVKA